MAGIGQARMYEIQQQNIQAFKSKIASGQINKDSTFVIKRYDKISDTVANILLAKGITNPTTEQIQEVKSQLLNNSDISGTIKAKNKGDMDLYFLKEGKSIDMSKIHVTGEIDQKALNELRDQLVQGQSNNGSLTDVSKPEVPKEALQLSEEDSQKLQNDIFKNQISNMSKKQLKQFAENSNDLNKLKMISEELGSRGKDHSKSIVDKKINLLEEQQNKSNEVQSETVPLSNGKPPATGPSPEENPQYDAIARGQSQSVQPQASTDMPVTNHPPVTYNDNVDNSEQPEKKNDNLTQEQIQESINNLKPGESFNYINTLELGSPGSGFYSKNTTPITWTRNNDGTLTKVSREISYNNGRGEVFFDHEIQYSADGKTILQEKTVKNYRFSRGLDTTIKYSDSKKESETIDLKDLNKCNTLGFMTPGGQLFSTITPKFSYGDKSLAQKREDENNATYASKELKNSQGEVVLTYKDGKFYNKKGKEISDDKACDLVFKLVEKNDVSELVQNYRN